jgi:DNA repair exonuclease SbcCD nuclease subunit
MSNNELAPPIASQDHSLRATSSIDIRGALNFYISPQSFLRTTYTPNFTRIFHLADIHLPGAPSIRATENRYAEFNVVLRRLRDNISQHINTTRDKDSLCVICGDIFDSKQSYGTETLELFSAGIESISTLCPVLLILGNHDMYEHDQARCDMIAAIINCDADSYKYKIICDTNIRYPIIYLHKSGYYQISNTQCIGLLHMGDMRATSNVTTVTSDVVNLDSITDINRNSALVFPCPDNQFMNIALYHGGVDGVIMNANGKRMCGESAEKLIRGYDIGLFGDMHIRRVYGAVQITPNKWRFDNDTMRVPDTRSATAAVYAYPGSLLQLNFGESLMDHGYLLWDLADKTVEIQNIQNNWGRVNARVSNGAFEINIQGVSSSASTCGWIRLSQFLATPSDSRPNKFRLRFGHAITSQIEADVRAEFIAANCEVIGNIEIRQAPIKSAPTTPTTPISNAQTRSVIPFDINGGADDADFDGNMCTLFAPIDAADGDHYMSALRNIITDIKFAPYISAPETLMYNIDVMLRGKVIIETQLAELRNLMATMTTNLAILDSARNVSRHKEFKIRRLAWSFILPYGANNCIDFEGMRQNVVLVDGENNIGKTSIMEIIYFGLYGEQIPTRHTASFSNIISTHAGPNDPVYINLRFALGDCEYTIHTDLRSTSKSSADSRRRYVKLDSADGTLSLTGLDQIDTWIKSNVSSPELFLQIAMITQNKDGDFIDMTVSAQYDLIGKMFNVEAIPKFIKYIASAKSFYDRLNAQLADNKCHLRDSSGYNSAIPTMDRATYIESIVSANAADGENTLTDADIKHYYQLLDDIKMINIDNNNKTPIVHDARSSADILTRARTKYESALLRLDECKLPQVYDYRGVPFDIITGEDALKPISAKSGETKKTLSFIIEHLDRRTFDYEQALRDIDRVISFNDADPPCDLRDDELAPNNNFSRDGVNIILLQYCEFRAYVEVSVPKSAKYIDGADVIAHDWPPRDKYLSLVRDVSFDPTVAAEIDMTNISISAHIAESCQLVKNINILWHNLPIIASYTYDIGVETADSEIRIARLTDLLAEYAEFDVERRDLDAEYESATAARNKMFTDANNRAQYTELITNMPGAPDRGPENIYEYIVNTLREFGISKGALCLRDADVEIIQRLYTRYQETQYEKERIRRRAVVDSLSTTAMVDSLSTTAVVDTKPKYANLKFNAACAECAHNKSALCVADSDQLTADIAANSGAIMAITTELYDFYSARNQIFISGDKSINSLVALSAYITRMTSYLPDHPNRWDIFAAVNQKYSEMLSAVVSIDDQIERNKYNKQLLCDDINKFERAFGTSAQIKECLAALIQVRTINTSTGPKLKSLSAQHNYICGIYDALDAIARERELRKAHEYNIQQRDELYVKLYKIWRNIKHNLPIESAAFGAYTEYKNVLLRDLESALIDVEKAHDQYIIAVNYEKFTAMMAEIDQLRPRVNKHNERATAIETLIAEYDKNAQIMRKIAKIDAHHNRVSEICVMLSTISAPLRDAELRVFDDYVFPIISQRVTGLMQLYFGDDNQFFEIKSASRGQYGKDIIWTISDSVGNRIQSIKRVGGFRMSLVSFFIRLVLNRICAGTRINCRQLFIDEAFNAADETNLIRIPPLLRSLLVDDIYDTIMIVTHREILRKGISHGISIERNGQGMSRISNITYNLRIDSPIAQTAVEPIHTTGLYCAGRKKDGTPCAWKAQVGSQYCGIHKKSPK